MALRSNICPKCGGRMALGLLLDRGDGNASKVAAWVEGAPIRTWFGSVRVRGLKRLEIESNRCEKCGFLENYAPQP